MTDKQIRLKALKILNNPKPTKLELEWWLSILDDLKLSNLSWENNLDIDISLKNRNVGSKLKLSTLDMYNIRGRYSQGDISQDELANEYGVSRNTIFYTLYPEKRKVKKDLVVTN